MTYGRRALGSMEAATKAPRERGATAPPSAWRTFTTKECSMQALHIICPFWIRRVEPFTTVATTYALVHPTLWVQMMPATQLPHSTSSNISQIRWSQRTWGGSGGKQARGPVVAPWALGEA